MPATKRKVVAAVLVLALLTASCGNTEPTGSPDELTAPTSEADEPSTETASTSVASASTTTATVAPPGWGEEARAWLDAVEAAAENGLVHLESFIAPDLVWDDRINSVFIEGADNWFSAFPEEDLFGVFVPRGGGVYFVSADGALRQHIVSFNLPKAASFLDRMEIGPDGVRHWIRSGSLDAGRWYQPSRVDFDVYDALADRYLALWNGDPAGDPASVYHEEATVADTVLGESVAGIDAIGRSAASRSWPAIGQMSIIELPDGAGRAVHQTPSDRPWMGPEEVMLLIEADDGTGCPGLMAVVLGLDGERVRWEQRYHDIDTARRCHETTTLQPGWWNGLEIPPPVFSEQTGTVTHDDMTIEILNGTPELELFVEWGLTRFDDAGIPLPKVASVSFIKAHTACYNLGGSSQHSALGANIMLCRTTDDICLDETCHSWAPRHRQLLLHELAHPWLEENTDEALRSEFLDSVELPRWRDPLDPWEQRGVERAADAIAFGLMDEPVDIAPMLAATCDERAASFRILTGADPMSSCDP